ncbi:unnamed protein product [Symbiodinium sp. CCMP2456]|nr:unnamed protein product [Symbiodinium sp. CCMP2456]
MGNSGWAGPPSEETQKANFRKCLQRECVPQVQDALQLRSVAEMGTKFGMVTAGRAETRLDPSRSEAAQLAARAETGLLACEHQCAKRNWPAALEQPWLGTVSIDMAGVAKDRTGGQRSRLVPN